MSLGEKILDVIEFLTDKSIQQAKFDKTIQAQIMSCQDQSLGKYKCKFQDAIFFAYGDPDTKYSKGTMVYVLVPGNDMSKDKTILGSVDKLGINYTSTLVGDEAYNIVGTNCVLPSDDLYYLDTKYKNYSYKIYPNHLSIDPTAPYQYLKQSTHLIVGAKIRTDIDPDNQRGGHYGMVFTLKFKGADGQSVNRSYVVDESTMVNNPYKLTVDTRQYGIFEIDGKNFEEIVSVEIFSDNFPNSDTEGRNAGRLREGDIILSAFEISGAVRLSQEELNGLSISFFTPKGTFFKDSDDDETVLPITAQLKIKGKLASSTTNMKVYWGIEDVSIKPESLKYNKHLGRGWQCLNEYNSLNKTANGQDDLIQWVPANNTYYYKKKSAKSYNNRLKVAIVYDGNVATKEINIINLSKETDHITITSSLGTKFYYGVGQTILTCNVKGTNGNLVYYWTKENNGMAAEDVPGNGSSITVAANEIFNFATYKCTVYSNGALLGTGSIVLTNSTQGEGFNVVRITNGDAIYKYNENGVAPTSKSLENSKEIKQLSFLLYGEDGEEIKLYNNNTPLTSAIVKWFVPNTNTLLDASIMSGGQTQGDYIVFGGPTLDYKIKERYDYSKTNNQIRLQVNYNGRTYIAETRFVFVKQGDSGTNGTQYFVRIVPNTLMSNPPARPTITKTGSSYYLNYGIGSANTYQSISSNGSYKFFNVEFYHNENRITSDYTQTWEVLRRQYSYNSYDPSVFSGGNSGYFTFSGYSSWSPWANIIKCTIKYKDKNYYATMPVITAYASSRDSLKLQDGTGFMYAIYASDGTQPQYDSANPFTIVGGTTSNFGITCHSAAEQGLTIVKSEIGKCQVRPVPRYDGFCVTNALVYSQGSYWIHIPIHLMLNRYELHQLNDWDGNSIKISDAEGYILAPQMGAGQKDSNNRFTGVLMGQVKKPSKSQSQVGLFGYHQGQRSFFLNSKNGAAIFGKKSIGQIIIDPTRQNDQNNRAMLYSSNFWEDYNDQGLPSSYLSTNEKGSGMLIDLTTPQIRFGNNNLKIDSGGNLSLGNGAFKVANTGDIYAGRVSNNNYNFKAENGSVTITGAINATSGTIGSGTDKWIIGDDNTNSYIRFGKRYLDDDNRNGIYIGTDGISLRGNGKTLFKADTYNGTISIDANSISLSKDTPITWGSNTTNLQAIIQGIVDGTGVPSYIDHTFINGKTISSPLIYGGQFYATGQGRYETNSSMTTTQRAAYYIYEGLPNSTHSNRKGYICYDTNGNTSQGDSQNRVIFTTTNNTVLKLMSAGNMSLQAGTQGTFSTDYSIYFRSLARLDRGFAVNQNYSFGTQHPSDYFSGGGWGYSLIVQTGQVYFRLES